MLYLQKYILRITSLFQILSNTTLAKFGFTKNFISSIFSNVLTIISDEILTSYSSIAKPQFDFIFQVTRRSQKFMTYFVVKPLIPAFYVVPFKNSDQLKQRDIPLHQFPFILSIIFALVETNDFSIYLASRFSNEIPMHKLPTSDQMSVMQFLKLETKVRLQKYDDVLLNNYNILIYGKD